MIPDGRFDARVRRVRFRGGFAAEPGFYVSKVKGLLSGGETTTDSIPSLFGPGVVDTPNRREDPRLITFEGLIIGESWRDLGARADQLGALLGEDDSKARLSWIEFDDWRNVMVRRGAGWDIERNRGSGTAFFLARFRAPDQRLYGPARKTAWSAVVGGTNRGGYPAPVVLEVRGDSAGGWTVAGPRGAFVAVTTPITPGVIHRYDCDTGVLSVNGVPQISGVQRSDLLELPPGDFTLAVNNGCELRAAYASTWAP